MKIKKFDDLYRLISEEEVLSISEDESEERTNEVIQEIVESSDFENYISEFLGERSLEVDEINYDGDFYIWVTYESKNYNGSIPSRITIYIDDLCKKLESDWFGVEVDWWFGENGNCSLVNLHLSETPDLKWLQAKKLLKYI